MILEIKAPTQPAFHIDYLIIAMKDVPSHEVRLREALWHHLLISTNTPFLKHNSVNWSHQSVGVDDSLVVTSTGALAGGLFSGQSLRTAQTHSNVDGEKQGT